MGRNAQGSLCGPARPLLVLNHIIEDCLTVLGGPSASVRPTSGRGHLLLKVYWEGVRLEAFSPGAFLLLMFSLQDWSANPMFERKDNKKEALLDLDGRVANLNKRYTAVKDAGLKIQAMVAVRRCLGRP